MVFVIQHSVSGDKGPSLYWSMIKSDRGSYGVWSFNVQDAVHYNTVAEAGEYASAYGGLNLTDDQFHILPYID